MHRKSLCEENSQKEHNSYINYSIVMKYIHRNSLILHTSRGLRIAVRISTKKERSEEDISCFFSIMVIKSSGVFIDSLSVGVNSSLQRKLSSSRMSLVTSSHNLYSINLRKNKEQGDPEYNIIIIIIIIIHYL